MIHFKLFIWFHDIVFYIVFPVFVAIIIWSRIRSQRANNNGEPQGILPMTITNAITALRERLSRRTTGPSQPTIVDGYVSSLGRLRSSNKMNLPI
jgi:hypothetical protein